MIDRLRDIINKPAKDITSADRRLIADACTTAGIMLEQPKRRGCNACWIEAALAAYNALTKPAKEGASKLKPGTDILFNGERVCEATATQARVERWIRAGLPKHYLSDED